MKKIILTLLIIHCTLLIANAQWIFDYQINTGNFEKLDYLCTVDTLSVWGIGTLGFPPDTSLVYKMKPPGIWYKLPMQDFMYSTRITCIAAIDTSKAWVGTYDGRIFVTTDGGYNWEMIFNFGGSSFINDIKFSKTNKLIGYANSDPPNGTGTPFKILKTTNGGFNWAIFSPTFTNNYYGMQASSCVTDENHYWMGLSYGNGIPRLAFTTNGGVNWLERTVPYVGNYLWPIEFTATNELGFCSSSGATPTAYLHKTTDGGFNWSNYFLLPIESGQPVNSMNWIEGTSNWYFSSSSISMDAIYKSTNNGLNWSPMIINNNSDQVNHLSFVRKNNRIWGYAATQNGKFYKLVRDTANLTSVIIANNSIPEKYSLNQNYTNPFNPVTKIKFDIAVHYVGQTLLSVYDLRGWEIQTLVNEKLNPGTYEVTFDGSNYASGVYFYRLRSGEFVETKKLVLLK